MDELITELLFDHDCVIMPGFGGFVANYRNAKLNRLTHVISPPSRQIGFNPHIAHNDGLLIHAVSKQKSIGYAEAEATVMQWLHDAKKSLSNGGRLNLHRIGILFHDKSGKLQFIPDEQENFLADSYGLPAVQLRQVKKPIQALESESVTVPSVHSDNNRLSMWKIAAVLLPVGLAGAMLLGSRITQDSIHFANLSPFEQKQSEILPMISRSEIPQIKHEEISWLDSALKKAGDASSIHYSFLDNNLNDAGIKVIVGKDKQAKKEPITKSSDGMYEIVGGAFMFEENADKYVRQLRKKGYNALRSGTHRGLFVVAIGRYGSEADADVALSAIRDKENSNAWIRRR
jgi:nucleoid DNA-binding protein